MKWPVIVTAETHSPSGRKMVMRRTVEGAGDVVGAMIRALHARRDQGYAFLGCEIRAVTPLGQKVIRTVEEKDGALTVSE